jgi:plastocyanin
MMRMVVVVALAVTSSVANAQAVPVFLSEWKVGMKSDTVKAGAVVFRVTNEGSMNHGLHVRGDGMDKGTKEIPARQSASLTLTLKPGTYELFCPMSEESHAMAGMKRTLVVLPGSPPPAAKP